MASFAPTFLFKRAESVATDQWKMDNSPSIDPLRTDEAEQPSSSPPFGQARDDDTPGHQVERWLERFRQLGWDDRLNMILAAFLGAVLIVVLSPVLLGLWIYLQVANRGRRSRPTESAEFKFRQP